MVLAYPSIAIVALWKVKLGHGDQSSNSFAVQVRYAECLLMEYGVLAPVGVRHEPSHEGNSLVQVLVRTRSESMEQSQNTDFRAWTPAREIFSWRHAHTTTQTKRPSKLQTFTKKKQSQKQRLCQNNMGQPYLRAETPTRSTQLCSVERQHTKEEEEAFLDEVVIMPDETDSSTTSTHTSLTSLSSSLEHESRTAVFRTGSSAHGILPLLAGTTVIYCAYLSYGMVQEDLYRYRNDKNIGFTYVWFLQVLESSTSILLGYCGRKLFGGRNDLQIRSFLYSGASQVFAKVFFSLSLAYGLSFPVVSLSKCAKIVPVMIGQVLLGSSRYSLRDCLFAILMVTGTVILSVNTKQHGDSNNTSLGVLFIVLSLFMDGCTGGLQKQLKEGMKHSPPTTFDFVYYTHMSMACIALAISLLTGDLWKGLVCISLDANILRMVASICALSLLGQVGIFFIIARFDSVVCATVTTTRKLWSVLLSIVFRDHVLNFNAYCGLVIAISGILIEVDKTLRRGNGGSKPSHSIARKTSDGSPPI